MYIYIYIYLERARKYLAIFLFIYLFTCLSVFVCALSGVSVYLSVYLSLCLCVKYGALLPRALKPEPVEVLKQSTPKPWWQFSRNKGHLNIGVDDHCHQSLTPSEDF